MSDKIADAKQDFKKERFEFSLTINGFYVCQRFFKINGFNEHSLSSVEIVEAVDKCVELIDRDLKSKTSMYLEWAAPVFFPSHDALDTWIEKTQYAMENGTYSGTFSISPFSFVAVRNAESEYGYDYYVWDGENMDPYDGNLNAGEFEKPSTDKCVLKFSFLDNGREVCSKVWDGSVYPKFIRSNIDLSNSKNRYDRPKNGQILIFESSMIREINKCHEDIIPSIVKELCHTCSRRKKYTRLSSY